MNTQTSERIYVEVFFKGKWRLVYSTPPEDNIERMLEVYTEQGLQTRIRRELKNPEF